MLDYYQHKITHNLLEVEPKKIWGLAEIKNYLRIIHDYDNDLLENLSVAACQAAENFTGICLQPRRIKIFVERTNWKIRLKYVPVVKIIQVLIQNRPREIDVSDNFGHLESKTSNIHLLPHLIGKNLEIEYFAGYQDAIPHEISHGILLHIAAMYDRDNNGSSLNAEIKNLYAPYRLLKI